MTDNRTDDTTGGASPPRGLLARIFDFLASDFQCWFSELGLRSFLSPRSPDSWPMPVEDGEALSKFRTEFLGAPAPASPASPPAASTGAPGIPAGTPGEDPQAESERLKQFFASAPGHLAMAQYSWERINHRTGDKLPPEGALSELCSQIRALKGGAGLPALLPVWQLASALEGLLQQLNYRVREVTPSTLRTAGSAMALLHKLCLPGLKADLATNPPIRLLAVDDDAVTRYAMNFSLKKAFDQPDIVENAEAALALAAQRPYDVIFLDVKMPGMDGFELCTKIHEIAPNRATPVIFVTGMKDFDSRTKSIASGGSDLIGKPFLPFEITTKALTFALERRLKSGDQAADASVTESTDSKAPPSSQQPADTGIVDKTPVATTPPPAVAMAPAQPVANAGAPGPSGKQPPAGLLAEASIGLQKIREYSQAVGLAEDENARWKIIAAMYLSLLALARSLENSELHPAFQMCSALAGLLKKLQENPKTATPSTLHTVTNAVDLLGDLCVAGVRPDLADNPRVNILVVDDDPLTRRAISVALQTAFLKPDNAEDGESALTLAAEIPYDVIFMDVQMPGIDGFTACAKIHETIPNRTTPVVFVTSQTDAASREKSAASGGRDFVTKPFIFVEITVKALTFALRNRLALAGK